MNGVHDMGGMHGFGPIQPRQNEETFHAEWEKRVPGLQGAGMMQGVYNIDEMRHGIERMDPAAYLTSSYYERHLFTVEKNFVEKGVLSVEEIEARVAQLRGNVEAQRRDDPELAERMIRARLRIERPPAPEPGTARFKIGQRVVARNEHPLGHTRLPRYVRGKHGVINRYFGVDTLPDASAHGRGPSAEPLYNVRFEAAELWGVSADGPGWVHVDLWESYLEPVEDERP
jgi:nitrile hydratase